jgi:hypothetical protein
MPAPRLIVYNPDLGKRTLPLILSFEGQYVVVFPLPFQFSEVRVKKGLRRLRK